MIHGFIVLELLRDNDEYYTWYLNYDNDYTVYYGHDNLGHYKYN